MPRKLHNLFLDRPLPHIGFAVYFEGHGLETGHELAGLRDLIDVEIKASEKTQVHLKAIVDSLQKHTQVADEVGRLLPRAADGLLTKVLAQLERNGDALERLGPLSKLLDQLAKNGEAVERLRTTIGEDVAGLKKE